MDMENKAFIKKVQWEDIRNNFALVNADLARIIDELNPATKYTLYKARYPFGSEILKDGILQIPNQEGELVSIFNDQLDPKIKESLSYNNGSNPVSILLKNSVELYMQLKNRIVPFIYGLISPGKIFGLWRVLNPEASQHPIFTWRMSAGSRSMFMLPKIAKTSSHKKLQQKFNLRSDLPRGILDHWHVFKELAQNQETKDPWFVDVLFFGKEWFEKMDDKAWDHFNLYLYKIAWQGSEFWRNEFVWDVVFSIIQERRNIKPDPYILITH